MFPAGSFQLLTWFHWFDQAPNWFWLVWIGLSWFWENWLWLMHVDFGCCLWLVPTGTSRVLFSGWCDLWPLYPWDLLPDDLSVDSLLSSFLSLSSCLFLSFFPVVPVKVAPPTERAPSLLLRVNLNQVCVCVSTDAVLLWTLLVIMIMTTLSISTLWLYSKWSAKYYCNIECIDMFSGCLSAQESETGHLPDRNINVSAHIVTHCGRLQRRCPSEDLSLLSGCSGCSGVRPARTVSY